MTPTPTAARTPLPGVVRLRAMLYPGKRRCETLYRPIEESRWRHRLFAPGSWRSEIEGLGIRREALSMGRVGNERLWAFRRLTLESALVEITQLFEQRGIRPLLLKGPAFAQWLYDEPRERTYGDLDLLVDPDQFDEAVRVLVELDFELLSANMRSNERHGFHHVH